MKVCIIGCGNVGSIIASYRNYLRVELKYFDKNPEKCKKICDDCPSFDEFGEMLKSGCDLVVEAASPKAVEEYAEMALKHAPLLVLSVGALLNKELLRRLEEASLRYGNEIVVPSGAIAGLDAIKALRIVGIDEVLLVTTKNPKALGVDVTEKTLLFEGSASEAVKRFPFNVNVVAALSLASGKEAKIRLYADPSVKTNVHEIFVKSKASNIYIKVENVPSPQNPKTSYLAALSVIQTIKEIVHKGGLRIGT